MRYLRYVRRNWKLHATSAALLGAGWAYSSDFYYYGFGLLLGLTLKFLTPMPTKSNGPPSPEPGHDPSVRPGPGLPDDGGLPAQLLAPPAR